MNRKFKEDVVPEIARARGLGEIGPEWDLASVWPLLEQVREDGAVLLLKLDGERSQNPYTVVLSGGRLPPENDVLRIDSSSMERAVAFALGNYGLHAWNLSQLENFGSRLQ